MVRQSESSSHRIFSVLEEWEKVLNGLDDAPLVDVPFPEL